MPRAIRSNYEMNGLRIAATGSLTISSGDGLSGALAIENCAVVRVNMPAGWEGTAAAITFQVSEDGDTYRDVYYWNDETPATSVEASVTVVESCSYAIPPEWTEGAAYVKVRAGTAATSIPQATNQIVEVVFRLV